MFVLERNIIKWYFISIFCVSKISCQSQLNNQKLKAEHDLPPADPTREAVQIARLEELAAQANLDPEFAKKFLNFIIQEVIQHHKQHQS